jgi:hypothetical protein
MSVLANAVPFLSLLIHSLLIYKVNNKGEREVGYHTHQREESTKMVRSRQKNATGENIKINYGMYTTGRNKKVDSKKNAVVRSSSNQFNKKLKTKSIDKQERMAFVFRNTAKALIKPDS